MALNTLICMGSSFSFNILKKDTKSKARLGFLETAHGKIETPVFMPVGTRAAVKTLTQQQLLEMDVRIIVANAYHLMLRPGAAVIEKGGGLHRLMNWPRSLLTDSGGFQIFSLPGFKKMTEEGVFFNSHIDGSKHFLGPLESMHFQKILGGDIAMALDACSFYPSSYEKTCQALDQTHRWAKICRDFELQSHQNLFAIIHGGAFTDLRRLSAQVLTTLPFEGFALGGLSKMPNYLVNAMIEATEPFLPEQKPRYLMGVGTPRDIIEAVMRGIDLFDCVIPTRNGRHGTAFTWNGKIHIKAGRYAEDFTPLDAELDGYPSQFAKAYIRHLMNVKEMTGLTLVSLQNLSFYLDFMRRLRQAIREDKVMEFYQKICKIFPSSHSHCDFSKEPFPL
jgi:queuine tRNA-ribosyltransferase